MRKPFRGKLIFASLPSAEHIRDIKFQRILKDLACPQCQEITCVFNLGIREWNRIPKITETDVCTNSGYSVFRTDPRLERCCIEFLKVIL